MGYLVSQSVRQGTVNPTSYNIIKNTSRMKPDHIQQLTYKQCHLYYNWPGTVRVPAVCQYAHKLAFLVGNSIHRRPNTELEELLYYLKRRASHKYNQIITKNLTERIKVE